MDNRSDKTEDRQITKLRRTQESTKRFQDHIVLVAEINWRRLGDRRTAGLGLAAVRHHWLTQRLPSLSNLFLCAIVPLALPAHSPLSLSLFILFSLYSPSLARAHSLYPTIFLLLALLDKLRLLTPYGAVQDDSSFLRCMKLFCLFFFFFFHVLIYAFDWLMTGFYCFVK